MRPGGGVAMVGERIPADVSALLRRLEADDPSAREVLARMHEALVRRWAGRFHREHRWIEWDDLAAEGRLAVLEALPHFRALNGASLTTYLDVAVRRHLLDFVERMGSLPQE